MGKDGLEGWVEKAGNCCQEDSGLWGICLLCNICESVTKDFGDEIKPANQLIIDTQQAQQHMTIHHS